jgi:hypothetical protein
MVDEDKSGVLRSKRLIRADWDGHGILLRTINDRDGYFGPNLLRPLAGSLVEAHQYQ